MPSAWVDRVPDRARNRPMGLVAVGSVRRGAVWSIVCRVELGTRRGASLSSAPLCAAQAAAAGGATAHRRSSDRPVTELGSPPATKVAVDAARRRHRRYL